MRRLRLGAAVIAVLACTAALSIPGAHLYYRSSFGEGCARCHEIKDHHETWQHSSHRKVNCVDCHSSSLTASLRRVIRHFEGDLPDRIHLGLEDVFTMVERCKTCHEQEFAQWRSGPHSTTYARIFMDPEHNQKRRLMDDCLRCHGMHFPGGVSEVVTPIDTTGPWRLTDPGLINKPAIPCLACHAVHRAGNPMSRTDSRRGPEQEVFRPSLALLDRRSQLSHSASLLPLPSVLDGGRIVRMSPDPRQALCYQCHSPLASRHVGSGDDRTPTGVHEGLSCLACHQKHGMRTRSSCADCHPRLSNCGIDVEKMDTTFLSPQSKNDIHRVQCTDCHSSGVPRRKSRIPAR